MRVVPLLRERVGCALPLQASDRVVKAKVPGVAADRARVASAQEPGVEVLGPFRDERLRGKF